MGTLNRCAARLVGFRLRARARSERAVPREDLHELVELEALLRFSCAFWHFSEASLDVVGQHDSAYFGKRSPHRDDLQEHVHAVAVLGKHSLKTGDLARDPSEARVRVATRLFVHGVARCMRRCLFVTDSVNGSAASFRAQTETEQESPISAKLRRVECHAPALARPSLCLRE